MVFRDNSNCSTDSNEFYGFVRMRYQQSPRVTNDFKFSVQDIHDVHEIITLGHSMSCVGFVLQRR